MENISNDKFVGILIGGCIGDVLGSTNENKSFKKIREKKLVTSFKNNKYTDDTEMTVVLAQYLLQHFGTEHEKVHTVHEMYKNVISHSRRGYSKRTREILTNYHHCSTSGDADTNGAIMRISPMALVPISDDKRLRDYIKQMVYCTHGENKNAVDVAFIHVKLLKGLISGKINTYVKTYEYALDLARRLGNNEVYPLIKLLAIPNLVSKDKLNCNITENIFGFDFMQIGAVQCYICVLACFLHNFDKPVNALIMAANLGGDTDTIAKLVGDLIGAMKGTSWIPEEWKNPEGADLLRDIGINLFDSYKIRK